MPRSNRRTFDRSGESDVGRCLGVVVTFVTLNHVSKRPSAVRSCTPVAPCLPFEQTTFARTTRGDTPCFSTLIPWNRPAHSEPSFDWICDWLSLSCQRCRGEVLSNGSATP